MEGPRIRPVLPGHGADGDGVGQLVARDEAGDERHAGRLLEGAEGGADGDQRIDQLDADEPADGEQEGYRDGHGGDALGADEQGQPPRAVGQYAAEELAEHERYGLGQAVEAEVEGVAGQLPDDPGVGNVLDPPGQHVANQAGPVEAKVGLGQGGQHRQAAARGGRGERGVGHRGAPSPNDQAESVIGHSLATTKTWQSGATEDKCTGARGGGQRRLAVRSEHAQPAVDVTVIDEGVDSEDAGVEHDRGNASRGARASSTRPARG